MNSVACTSNLREFAARERIRISTHPDDGTMIVAGKFGHIYEFDDRRLAVLHMPECRHPGPRFWNSMRERCKAAGMHVEQDGECEGSLTFSALNPVHVALALRLAGVKRMRQLDDGNLQEGRRYRPEIRAEGCCPEQAACERDCALQGSTQAVAVCNRSGSREL